MKTCLLLGAVAALVLARIPLTAAQTPGEGTLSLEEALERAQSENPRLKAAAQRIDFATGGVRQAHLRPNPELGWEGEEIGGDRRGFGQAEHTFTLSQVVELGGKRSSRIRSARAGVSIAEIELESLRRNILAETTLRFTETALAQRRMGLVVESIALAEELRAAAQERVDAGAAPNAEAIRAEVVVSDARLDSVAAFTSWMTSKTALAIMWGDASPDFDKVRTDVPQAAAPPPLSSFLPHLDDNPDIRRWTASIQRARHSLRAARAMAVPDLTVSAGPRFLAEDRSQTFVLGVSVPIPLFSRNQGDIAGSRSAISEAEWEHRAAVVQLRSSLTASLLEMGTAYDAIRTVRDEIVPSATAAFEDIQRGYRQGRFDYLDLLAAQQDLIRSRTRQLDALSVYHQRRIEVERLTGTPIAETGGNNGQ